MAGPVIVGAGAAARQWVKKKVKENAMKKAAPKAKAAAAKRAQTLRRIEDHESSPIMSSVKRDLKKGLDKGEKAGLGVIGAAGAANAAIRRRKAKEE